MPLIPCALNISNNASIVAGAVFGDITFISRNFENDSSTTGTLNAKLKSLNMPTRPQGFVLND